MRGVSPLMSVALTFAPAPTSNFTMSSRPARVASCNAVVPPSRALTAAGLARMRLNTFSTSPRPAASCNSPASARAAKQTATNVETNGFIKRIQHGEANGVKGATIQANR